MRVLLTLAIGTGLLAFGGCKTVPPVTAQAQGELKGSLVLAWDGSDKRFIFMPAENDPLIYITKDRREIRPQRMYTDGGSIPRIFWSVSGLSPWAYGPAYTIHDYLFNQNRCWLAGKPNDFAKQKQFPYSIDEANAFLYDAMLIVEQNVQKDLQSGKIKSAKDAAFASRDSRALVKTAVDQFGGTAWADKSEGACLSRPEREFKVEVVKPLGAPSMRTFRQGAKFVAVTRTLTKRVEVKPVELITFTYD